MEKEIRYYTIHADCYTVGMTKFEIIIKVKERQVIKSGYIRMIIRKTINALRGRFIKSYWCQRNGDGEICHISDYETGNYNEVTDVKSQ